MSHGSSYETVRERNVVTKMNLSIFPLTYLGTISVLPFVFLNIWIWLYSLVQRVICHTCLKFYTSLIAKSLFHKTNGRHELITLLIGIKSTRLDDECIIHNVTCHTIGMVVDIVFATRL